jgi:hypothetical protein
VRRDSAIATATPSQVAAQKRQVAGLDRVAKLTSAPATPSVLASTRWTRDAQEPQVIPSTVKSILVASSVRVGMGLLLVCSGLVGQAQAGTS